MFGSHGFDLIVVSCSINVDGAAEPVPDDLNEEEEEEENEAEELRSKIMPVRQQPNPAK